MGARIADVGLPPDRPRLQPNRVVVGRTLLALRDAIAARARPYLEAQIRGLGL